MDLDEPLTLLVDSLPERLRAPWLGRLVTGDDGETLNWEHTMQGLLEADGTLLLILRTAAAWDNFDGFLDSDNGQIVNRHGVLVTGGLAFIERIHREIDLHGIDPIRHIEQTCLALAGKEYDRSTPELAEYVAHIAEERAERVKYYKLVESKARALLEAHLTPDQLEEFKATDEFHIQGADGYEYLLTNKFQHNVFRIEGGRRTVEYCIVTREYLPNYDQMLAQKLLLQANPEMFHKITNTWALTEDGKREMVSRGVTEPLLEQDEEAI